MKSHNQKKIIIIAGPNGAGKTTFAEEFLPKEANCPIFINADLIAAGFAPFDPDRAAFKAGRLMLAEILEHSRRGESFAFETTLSGRGYAKLIPGWRADDYIVKLFFLRLAPPSWLSPVSVNGFWRAGIMCLNRLSIDGLRPGCEILKPCINRLSVNGRCTIIPAAPRNSSQKE